MAYDKTIWQNGGLPALNATNLNKMEQGIYDATYPSFLEISDNAPQLKLDETDTTTSARLFLTGGALYLQAGGVGAGTTTSGGNMYFTGYNGAELNSAIVKSNTGLRIEGQDALLKLQNLGIGGSSGYIEFLNSSAARSGYFGYSSDSSSHLRIHNDKTDGNVTIEANGNTNLVANSSGNTTINGFTNLGSGPAIKQKKLTGTTGAAVNEIVTSSHGLTSSKILSVSILVDYNDNLANFMPPHYSASSSLHYTYYITSTNIAVRNGPSATGLLSKPYKILITYEE